MTILEKLYDLQDIKYADFQAKLTPTVDKDKFIGVRVPNLRCLAKELYKNGDYTVFLESLPHNYYEENMLHALIISELKDYDLCVEYINKFLPYIDNWAVCDSMNPKVFAKNKQKAIKLIYSWAKSKHTYTCRFGIDMLMKYFLDEAFETQYLKLPASIKSDEYYVKMMIAWYYATALAKQWDSTILYFENPVLDIWTHNKTIQKAKESFRITPSQKEFLKSLKLSIKET